MNTGQTAGIASVGRRSRMVRLTMMACAGLMTLAAALPAAAAETTNAAPAICPAGVAAMDHREAELVANKTIPGAVYIVSAGGKTVHSEVLGFADAAKGTPMQADSLFRLASMTKPITAVAIMTLVDQGKLSLDDPISRYLPEFADMEVGPYADAGTGRLPKAQHQITIRNVLTHTAGIEADPAESMKISLPGYLAHTTLAAQASKFAAAPIGWEPGTRWQYSPLMGFDILGRIIEVVSGQSLDQYDTAHIFAPLGMDDTTFRPTDAQRQRLVNLYSWHDGAWQAENSPITPYTYLSGAGGVYSTAGDYLKFIRMLEGHGTSSDVRILSQDAFDQLVAMQVPAGFPGLREGTGYGLGMRVIDHDPNLGKGSFGWSGALGTHFWVDPKNDRSAVYMINLPRGADTQAPGRMFESLVASAFPAKCPTGN